MDTLSYVGGLIVGLLLNEAVDISPWLARRVIRWSARRVPDAELARDYEEEWTALLSERPGKLLKLIYSLTFIWPAFSLRRDLQGRASWPRRLARRHIVFWTGPRMIWGMLLVLPAMACQAVAERLPDAPGTDTLFYAVGLTGAVLMAYVGIGMATAARVLRRLSARAESGDAEAQRQMEQHYGGWRGADRSSGPSANSPQN
ncbi:hypothetical protein ABZ943_00410 [Streptomyces rubiginosohelvolus]|uniref:hypothetical protein n=1 Tax=Streptomyces rubiginosohelvolus TaxID=67362 RepID=UPI0033D5EA8D